MADIVCDCCGKTDSESFCSRCYNDLISDRDRALDDVAHLERIIEEQQNTILQLEEEIFNLKGGK
jgi:hypothetical protein